MAAAAFDDDPYGYDATRRRTSVSGAPTGTAVSTTPMAVPRGTAPTPTYTTPYEEGGITGGSGGALPEPPAPPTFYGIGNFDTEKMKRPQGESFKYDWINTARKYDPTKGITADLLKELNAFGYGNFSGSGQHLSLSGLTDKGRAAGLLGDYRDADMITGYANGTNPGAVWGYQDPFAESMNSGGSGSIDTLLSMFAPTPAPSNAGFIGPDQLAAILKTLTPPPAAPSAPPMTFTLPEPEQAPNVVSQDYAPSLLSGMASPEVGKALQVIAMKYPGLLAAPTQGNQGGLVAEILRLIGGGSGVYA